MTAEKRPAIERALASADPAIRLFLLYGPDEAGSRALAARLAERMGADAERIDLAPALLKSDPARLADEAAAVSLFGGARWIRIEGAGDDCVAAVDALLDASAAGNPVVAIAGSLRRDSTLVKRAVADKQVMAFASYAPEGAAADRLAVTAAQDAGLRIDPDLAHRLAAATGGDRALIAAEIEKLALYLDAAPERPKAADLEAFEAIGAGVGDADPGRLAMLVASGAAAPAEAELQRLAAEGSTGIPLLRVMATRLLLLAKIRAEVSDGDSVETAMGRAGKAIFWRDREAVQRQVQRWSPERLAAALARIADAERAIKAGRSAGDVIADEALLTIARGAARR